MSWATEISDAADRIRPHIVQTPLLDTPALADLPVSLKLEQLQHTGSFKARGAFNTLLSHPVPEAGIVAASGGNHGAAVAFAARKLGYRATIFVPEIAGPAKIAQIRSTGADLTVVPGVYANALEQARAFEARTGAMQIHAYDAPATVAGQGSCFAEWDAQGLDADTVLIAVGGGGLLAGALAWWQGRRNVIAVEPENACALHAAQQLGAPTDVEVSGVAANALGARRIGQIAFDLATDTPSVLVTDTAITQAQKRLWQQHRLLVEPAGAAALSALTSGAYRPAAGERVAVLICGGNLATDPLA
ncbi:threonine/serine dehydratase [Puniceibacterium confluentis]|uniref:threonine/serine dehydratase n=1 Tax=Puniceibacterium confluentis TaxID=1958944 RepID=UPI0011B5377A|nr:threonine/serine dehydratase [Puniceibacterium confluentis]